MSEWSTDIKIDNYNFRIKKSNDKKHKYIVWLITPIDKDKVMLSSPLKFGDIKNEHYFDKFKQYSYLNHNDKKRQEAFKKRFQKLYDKNKNNVKSAIFWSWNYLW